MKNYGVVTLIVFVTICLLPVGCSRSSNARLATPDLVESSDVSELSDNKEVEIPIVVIDPGHGGEELGAVGVKGLCEKDVVLNISKYLDELLKSRLGVRTILTRSSDVHMDLADRTKLANKFNADLFISIHANATWSKRACGIETYYLDNTNDKSSLRLAQAENQILGGLPNDLAFMLSDLIQTAKQPDSIAFAHYLQSNLVQALSARYQGIRDLGVKKAPFFVLVGAHMPCALVEVSFIDHPLEGLRLADTKYQKIIAEALYLGIRDYLQKEADSKGTF